LPKGRKTIKIPALAGIQRPRSDAAKIQGSEDPMFGWKKKDKGAAKPEGGAAVLEKEPPSLKIKVLERRGCAAALAVTVPAGEVSDAVEEAFAEIQKRVKLPGFRPGKAPLEMVRQSYHGSAVEHGINNVLRETVHHALEQEKIVPLETPSVDKVEYKEGQALRYEVRVECSPEIVLKDYKGLSLIRKASPVGEAQVVERLDALRESNAKLAPSADEAVSEKNFVLVDYTATFDGKPVEGGTAKDQLIEMSAPQSLAGFNDALKGMKKDETKDVPLRFPDDHPNKALAGKTVSFKVVVKDIKEKRLPAADDEFAKDMGLESLTQLKERLRTGLEAERARREREDLEHQIIDGLLNLHPFDVPASLVERRSLELTERMKTFLLSRGASEAEWAKNEPSMKEKNRTEAERQIRLSYLLVEIAQKEGIQASDSDVDAAVAKSVKESAAEKAEDVRKWLEERRESLRAQVKEEKIFTFLIEKAQVTEEPAA